MVMTRAKGLKASLFILVLLHDKLVKMGGADIWPIFDTNYCLNAPQLSFCPTPVTFDMVNLQAFAGKWFEIGSNAKFKLFRENGLACNTANYTVTSTPPNFLGVTQSNLSIVDSGVTSIGPLGEYGITQISLASRGLCQNARSICSLITVTSQLGQALTQLAATSSRLLLLHAVDATELIMASANISEAMKDINTALDALSRNVTVIQTLNGQISQANGSLQENLYKLNNVVTQTGFVQDAIQQAVKTIALARGVIIQVLANCKLLFAEVMDKPMTSVTDQSKAMFPPAEDDLGATKNWNKQENKITESKNDLTENVMVKLLFEGGVDMPVTSLPDLGKAMFLVAGAEQEIMAQAEQIELTLFGISATTAVVGLDGTKPGTGGHVTVSGTAVQNSSYAGKLTAHIKSSTAPFLILGVQGWVNSGYTAALVYSCIEVPNTRYKQGLFIISRTPTLSQIVVDSLLDIARLNGIQTTCDDPFLYTVQESPFCFPNTSLTIGTP